VLLGHEQKKLFERLLEGKSPAMALTVEGTPLPQLNCWVVGLCLGALFATLLGLLVDALPCMRKSRKENGHPRGWVIATLVFSYALLIPALWAILFSFNIGALDSMSLKASTDSMLDFIYTLGSTGSWWGAALVALLAIGIPVVKMALLICGEYYRNSEDPKKVMFARSSIRFVQAISKWACPDMIAYILLLYLIRSLNHPTTLNGLFKLDVGFTCYTLFCFGSTVSCMGVSLPALPESQEATSPILSISRKISTPLLITLVSAFIACLTVGLYFPCMALRLDIQVLIDNGSITQDMVPFLVDTLHLPDLAKADVTIPNCIRMLAEHQKDAFDANAILALITLAVFVVGFTVLDMIALVVAAYQSLSGSARRVEDAPRCSAMAVSRKLKKLGMLDVTILGIIIVVASGTVYKKQGLILAFQPGLLGLMGAEVLHYAMYFLVNRLDCNPTTKALEEKVDCEIGNNIEAGPAGNEFESVVPHAVVPRVPRATE